MDFFGNIHADIDYGAHRNALGQFAVHEGPLWWGYRIGKHLWDHRDAYVYAFGYGALGEAGRKEYNAYSTVQSITHDRVMQNKMLGTKPKLRRTYRLEAPKKSGSMPRFGGSYSRVVLRGAPRRSMGTRPQYARRSYPRTSRARGGYVRRRTYRRRPYYRRRRTRTYRRRWY